MSELKLVRGLIVDDEINKTKRIAEAFRECGGLVVMEAIRARDVYDLINESRITPRTVDVVFIDSNLGFGMGGGRDVLGLLHRNDLERRPVGGNEYNEPVLPEPNRLVTVGTSTEPEWAAELGSYSDVIHGPLIVEWETAIRPLNMVEIVQEVRRLKP